MKKVAIAIRQPLNWHIGSISIIFGFLLGIILPSVLLFVVYVLYLPELPDPEQLEEYQPPLVSRMYSSDGVLLADFAGERRIWVPIGDVSPCFIKALMDTEDKRFFEHWGIDLFRIVGAMVANLKSGRIVQGGSTITQQLSRNLFLTRQKVLVRKIKEALTAIRLEHKYCKSEILELYVNQNYMGKGCYGVQSASQYFFGESASELTADESALLVGLLRAPSYYLRDPKRAIRRRNVVLNLMAQSDFMSDACAVDPNELDSLCAIPFDLKEKVSGKTWKSPYFVDFVRQKLADKYGSDWIYTQGVTIYTTLDYYLTQTTLDTMRNRLNQLQRRVQVNHFPNDPVYTKVMFDSTVGDTVRRWKEIEGGVFAMENETGRILVMLGGKNFQRNQFNRVTQAIRQPGSAFKPFVYTAAIDNGWQPSDLIDDTPGVWPMVRGKIWRPHNYDHKYLGSITLREALQKSRNLATIRLCDKVGPSNVIKYARRLGITTALDPVLSIAMGSSGVKLWDMVIAYSVFPNNGVKVTPVYIDRIVNRNGTVIFEGKTQKKEVLSKGTAYVMSSMLQSVIDHGTGYAARMFGFLHPAGGKTGTTNDYTDAWFIGFTKKITAGVCVGYNDLTPIGEGMTGSRAALPTWTKLMLTAYPKSPTPADDFDVPYGEVIFLNICKESGLLATERCPKIHEVFLRKNPVPDKYCPLSHSPEDSTKLQNLRRRNPKDSIPPSNIDQINQKQHRKGGL
ncbi:PBP1A family penicillin-binding protein [bacterium]|nr:PBP1A family penicillin-binding protein [bacterium]